MAPADILADAGNLFGAIGAAMGLAGPCDGRRAIADDRLARDHDRLVLILRPAQRLVDLFGIVSVDGLRRPACRLKACALIGRIGKLRPAINGDRIVVEKNNQLVELQMPGQRDRFMADAFHEAAIASNNPGLVIDKIIPEARVQMPLRDRHADGCRDALAKRPRRRLDARRHEIFWMARRLCAQLAEIADVIAADTVIAGEMQQRIDEHGAMPRRQHEPVAVRPVWIGRIMLQIARPEDRRDICHPKWKSHMA